MRTVPIVPIVALVGIAMAGGPGDSTSSSSPTDPKFGGACAPYAFDDDVVGAFPGAPWLDVGLLDPSPPNPPDPSVTVEMTTDAFGLPTQAMEIPESVAPSQGIYAPLSIAPNYAVSADVRIEQFSDGATVPETDWAIAIGVAQFVDGVDISVVPQVVIYAASLTQAWHVYAFSTGDPSTGGGADLGIQAVLGVWYHVELELDAERGVIRSRIWDIATGALLIDQTDEIADWTPADGAFDLVVAYDGELSEGVTVANRSFVDNICGGLPGVPGDIDGDGSVGIGDLLLLLAAWGPCADCDDCPADLDSDCAVGVSDLLVLLAYWG